MDTWPERRGVQVGSRHSLSQQNVPQFHPSPKNLDFAAPPERRANSRQNRQVRMPPCDGAEALERCWHLGDKGEACSSVCGAVELMDGIATESLASSEPVVVALTLRYGLPPWRAATLGSRCDDHGVWESSAFLWLEEVQVWQCFPGEGLTHLSPVFRAPCAWYATEGSNIRRAGPRQDPRLAALLLTRSSPVFGQRRRRRAVESRSSEHLRPQLVCAVARQPRHRLAHCRATARRRLPLHVRLVVVDSHFLLPTYSPLPTTYCVLRTTE